MKKTKTKNTLKKLEKHKTNFQNLRYRVIIMEQQLALAINKICEIQKEIEDEEKAEKEQA